MQRKLPTGLFFLLLLVISVFNVSCNSRELKPAPVADSVKDTTQAAPAPEEKITEAPADSTPLVITYHALPTRNINWKRFFHVYRNDSLKIILSLNRLDADHIWKADTLVVPDTFLTDVMLYSPFPATLPAAKDVRKLIFFDYTHQSYGVYEGGTLIRWGPVSMGKRSTPTPTGLFYTNWKAKETKSTVNEEWVLKWYFNLGNFSGVSMHQYDLPGYPASHACMRLSEVDAKWFYYWADQWKMNGDRIAAYGTPVIIFGNYKFGKRRPWRALPEDNNATSLSREELEKELVNHLPTIVSRQALKDTLTVVK